MGDPTRDAAPVPVDPRQYRAIVGLFATGVTIITATRGSIAHGMTANAVSSVSLDPTLLLVCIDRRARLHDIVLSARNFAVNILAEDQEELSNHFAGRFKDGPPPASLQFETDDGGKAPAIGGALAVIHCTVDRVLDGGDHSIVLGRVDAVRAGRAGARPLVFYAGGYRRLAEHDHDHLPAPDPWLHGSARLYFAEWDAPPTPDERALNDE